jgi:predicted DsbA family dithiol-disulfide isomerase
MLRTSGNEIWHGFLFRQFIIMFYHVMETKKQATLKSDLPGPIADSVEVTFYTDPLCCWSWAMAPAWDRLKAKYGATIKVRYKMGGLLPSWKHSEDAADQISRPSQMGPEWMHAAHLSGVTINNQVWITDPPASSYPSCIAVKCAQLQSDGFVETYLHHLRKAVMVEGKNIAKTGVLLDTAWLLHDKYRDFDLFQFRDDLMGDAGKEAFKKDLQDAKYFGINRFPTLVIKRKDRSTVMLTGYQTYESLKNIFNGQRS